MGSGLLDSHVTSQLARTEIMAAVRHIARYSMMYAYTMTLNALHRHMVIATERSAVRIYLIFFLVIAHEILEAGN